MNIRYLNQLMKELYDKLGEKSYRYLAVSLCFLGDLELSKYIFDKFTDPQRFEVNFQNAMLVLNQVYKQQGMDLNLPPDFKSQVMQMITTMLIFTLGIYIVFHLINYIFFVFKKRFAHLYVRFLSWTATFLAPIMGIAVMKDFPIYGTLFIFQGAFFLFTALGTSKFPVLKKQLE